MFLVEVLLLMLKFCKDNLHWYSIQYLILTILNNLNTRLFLVVIGLS